MNKFRKFDYPGNTNSNFVDEWLDIFNEESYLDDQFSMKPDSILFLYDGLNWYRSLASPFFLEDTIFFGRLDKPKSHKKYQKLRLFALPRDVVFQDEWSLDYLQKKRISYLKHEIQGRYRFFIQRGEDLLKNLIPTGFQLGSISFIEFSKRMNEFIQFEIVSSLANLSHQEMTNQLGEIKKTIQSNVSSRFQKLGLMIESFEINFLPSK
jgi:hypothetical protein